MKRFYKQFALSVIILYLIIAFVLLLFCFCFAPIESAVYQLGDRNVFVCLQRDFSNRNIYAYFDDSPDFKDISRNIYGTREKKAGNWEIMQFVGRLFNTQRASVVVMRS